MSPKARLLVIDDESQIRLLIKGRLERRGFEVMEASEGAEAIEKYHSFQPDLAITDLRMPGLGGFEVLKALKIPVILITGHGDKESAIKAVELGAFAFFEKPFDLDSLEIAVKRGLEKKKLESEKEDLLAQLEKLCRYQDRELEFVDSKEKKNLVGKTPAIEAVRSVLERLVLKPAASLLILGESGTGKEVVARELHAKTHGSSERIPLLALNCAAIPTELFESELYGHEKGSFSGALQTRVGLAEAVREGTLFLDEIGELDPRHQAKLLRILQERQFRRVGSNKEIAFKGRIVAATHRNLKDKDKFREDLLYRLSVVTVTLPPLRERGEDILDIAAVLCARHGLRGLAPERAAELKLSMAWKHSRTWNWIERASILGLYDKTGFVIDQVPSEGAGWENIVETSSTPAAQVTGEIPNLKEYRDEVLKRADTELIGRALQEAAGNLSLAARKLGIDRKNLSRRAEELGLLESWKKRAA